MSSTARDHEERHPLLEDRELLNQVLDIMYAMIHKVLYWDNPGRSGGTSHLGGAGSRERILPGGTSADDILADAFEALLAYSPTRLRGSWQGLATRIARNKAIQALRTSRKGLRGTAHRPELRLLSGDTGPQNIESGSSPSIFEALPADWGDPEAEYEALEGVRNLVNLAREVLDGRDQQIFFDIHFIGYTRKEVGQKLGLTGARVGQIYKALMSRLEADPRYPYPTKRK